MAVFEILRPRLPGRHPASHLVRWTVIGILLLACEETRAASLVPRPLEHLVQDSQRIAHVRVLATTSRWTPDRRTIVTDVRLSVEETYKGAATGRVWTLTQPGGTVGALHVEVWGATPFRAGDEAIVFLRETAAGSLVLTGLDQGRFDVVEDPQSATRRVRPALAVASAKTPTDPERPGVAKPSADRQRPALEPLDEFVHRLRSVMRRTRPGGER